MTPAGEPPAAPDDQVARLREELYRERSRSAELARQVQALRETSSFRFGHAVARGLQGGARFWIGRAVARGLLASLRRSLSQPDRAGAGRRRRANVIVFVAWGADEAALEQLGGQVDRLQAIVVGFQPVFLLDASSFEPIRRRGHRVEYIVSLAEWASHRPAHTWSAYVTERVAAIMAQYAPRIVVVRDSGEGPSPLEQGVFDAILVPSVGRSGDNLLGSPDPADDTFAGLVADLLEPVASPVTPASRRRRGRARRST